MAFEYQHGKSKASGADSWRMRGTNSEETAEKKLVKLSISSEYLSLMLGCGIERMDRK